MVITSKLSNEQLLSEIHKAALVYESLLGKKYLIVGKNKRSEYFWFECEFEKKNFMHLLGIKSETLSADAFYDKCIEQTDDGSTVLSIADCTPSRNHNRRTINEKCSCCAEMLKLENAKYMKFGEKDKISQFVDFSYAYGNAATLGFRKKTSAVCFPLTLIPKSIDEFATQKYKIIFTLQKECNELLYAGPMIEIKKDLLSEVYKELPEDLRSLITDPRATEKCGSRA